MLEILSLYTEIYERELNRSIRAASRITLILILVLMIATRQMGPVYHRINRAPPGSVKMNSFALNNPKGYPESDATIKTESQAMLTCHLFEDNYLLEEIDRIIRERWKTIGRTTRYGWLAAYSYRKTIAQEDAKVLTGLANKIGLENFGEAIDKIRKISKHLHPNDIPTASTIILNETYMALMLRQRRGSKSSNKPMKDQFPTVFTISDACCLPSSSIR